MGIYQHLSRPASAYVRVGVDAPSERKKGAPLERASQAMEYAYGKGIKSLARWLPIMEPTPVT